MTINRSHWWAAGGGGGGQVDVSSQTNATVNEFHLKLLTNNYTKYEGRLVWPFLILLEPC